MNNFARFISADNSKDVMQWLKMEYEVFGRPVVQRYVKESLASINDSKCASAMSNILDTFRGARHENVGLRMLEASGVAPQGILAGNVALLGDYDECLDTRTTSFSGQYCLMTACLSPDQKPCESYFFLTVAMRARGAFSAANMAWERTASALEGLPLRVGLCVPSACGASDVRALTQRALRPLHQGLRVELDDVHCRVDGDESFGAAEFFVLGLIMIMVSWCAIASIYDYFTRGRRRNELVTAFSALRNGHALLRIGADSGGGGGGGGSDGGRGGGGVRSLEAGSSKGGGGGGDGGGEGGGRGGDAEGRDALPPLHALRVISFLFVVLGHSFLAFLDVPSVNLELAYKMSTEPIAVINAIAPLSVDVFLVLGGLLVAYVFFNHMASGHQFQWAPFYIYRYVRLTPALGVLLLLQTTVIMKMNDGPLWRMQPAQQCPKTWWYIMLHICNYFRPDPVKCLGHSWYLSMDWQLYILSPVVLLAMRHRPRRTLITIAVIIGASLVARFTQIYHYRLRMPFTPNAVQESRSRLNYPTHSRFEPYLVGIVLGYVLHHLKRKSISLALTHLQIRTVWTATAAISIFVCYEMWLFMDPDLPYNRLHESLFVTGVHFLAAISVALIVLMTMAGHGGLFGWILCQRWWRPLSRLTFCMYLVHDTVLQSIVWNSRTPLAFSVWSLAKLTFIVWILTIPFAFILAVLFECPSVQIARLLFAMHLKRLTTAKTEKCQKNGDYVIIGHSNLKKDQYLN